MFLFQPSGRSSRRFHCAQNKQCHAGLGRNAQALFRNISGRFFRIMLQRKYFVRHFIQTEFFHLFVIRAGQDNLAIGVSLEEIKHGLKNPFIPDYERMHRVNQNYFHVVICQNCGQGSCGRLSVLPPAHRLFGRYPVKALHGFIRFGFVDSAVFMLGRRINGIKR